MSTICNYYSKTALKIMPGFYWDVDPELWKKVEFKTILVGVQFNEVIWPDQLA
jgi:hypothetical protein